MAETKGIQPVTSAVLSGAGHEVARLLRQTPEQRTVAVVFSDDGQGKAAEQLIRELMEFLPQLIRDRQQETLNKLIDAFLAGMTPRRPPNRPLGASRTEQRC